MRISSTMFYSSSLSGIMNQQSAMSTLNQQLVSDSKLLTAADDPVAASQVMSLNDRVSLSTQYTANLQNISQTQQEETTVLNQIQTNLASAKTTLSGLNANSSQNLRSAAAATLSGIYQQIKDMANYQDSTGNYIFSGFKTDTAPYSHSAVYGTPTTTSTAATYQGDNGFRQVQIAQGQAVQSNENLASVFQAGSPTSDLLQTLDQVAADLQNGTATQASLTNAFSIVNSAVGNLQNLQAALAGRQLQVSNQQDTTKQLLTNNLNALSDLTKVDQASTIIELQQRQTSLQAAESAFASTSKLSLFNYLG